MPDANMPGAHVLDARGPDPALIGPPPAPPRHGHALWWTALAIVVLAAAAGGGWWWFAHRAPAPVAAAKPPMKVPVMTVAATTVPIYRNFPATTEAMRSVPIQARVTGYLLEQGAVDGADVLQGAMLYRIDPRDYQAALAQAVGQRDRSTASLSYSRVSQARNATLARDGWVSHDTFDQADSTNRQNQAGLATDSASLQAAALNLSRTEIRAPFAGRISRSQVFEGSLISIAGTTLNTLVQLDPIYVSFSPAEANLVAISRAQAARPIETSVSVGQAPPSHSGPVTFIDNQVDRTTGTIVIRATVANTDHALLPGQFVTARLHLGDLAGALLVPQDAVVSAQTGRSVLIVNADDKVEQRQVKLGDSQGDMIVVTDGLKAGDRVITGQQQKLMPGASVAPQPAPPS